MRQRPLGIAGHQRSAWLPTQSLKYCSAARHHKPPDKSVRSPDSTVTSAAVTAPIIPILIVQISRSIAICVASRCAASSWASFSETGIPVFPNLSGFSIRASIRMPPSTAASLPRPRKDFSQTMIGDSATAFGKSHQSRFGKSICKSAASGSEFRRNSPTIQTVFVRIGLQ